MNTQTEQEGHEQHTAEEINAFEDDGTIEQPTTQATQVEPEPETKQEESVNEQKEPTQGTVPEPTQDQIDLKDLAQKMERLMSGMDKAHGNYGELKRELTEMKKAAATPQAAAAFVPSEDAFQELDAFEMPDLKAGIQKGVAAAIEQRLAAMNQNLNPEQLAEHHSRLRQAEVQAEIEEGNRLLDAHYPDRFDTIKTPEWKQWEKTLNPIVAEKFYQTRDPEYVALRLDEFKNWKASQDSKKNSQNKRLETAIAPRGDKMPVPQSQNERDAELAAFNSND